MSSSDGFGDRSDATIFTSRTRPALIVWSTSANVMPNSMKCWVVLFQLDWPKLCVAMHPGRIFSNHGVVLFYVAANPNATIRTMAEALGITERQVSRILRDLADSDMIEVKRHGRRNSYTINPDAYLRHPTLSHVKLRRIVNVVAPELKSKNGVERG
jgi:hypothetical protein